MVAEAVAATEETVEAVELAAEVEAEEASQAIHPAVRAPLAVCPTPRWPTALLLAASRLTALQASTAPAASMAQKAVAVRAVLADRMELLAARVGVRVVLDTTGPVSMEAAAATSLHQTPPPPTPAAPASNGVQGDRV